MHEHLHPVDAVVAGPLGCIGELRSPDHLRAINAAQESFFAGKTECKYTEGSSGLTLTRSGTCTDTTACTATEVAVLDTYASCVSSAKVCSPGNEKQAATEMTACAFTSLSKVSASCASSIK